MPESVSRRQAILTAAKGLNSVCGGERLEKGSYVSVKENSVNAINHIMAAMFPAFFSAQGSCAGCEENLERAYDELNRALRQVYPVDFEVEAVSLELIEALPSIKELLETDITAAYRGDPAAKSRREIMLTYPGFTAISIYRIAHMLYLMKVPLIPRIMTEHAHCITGIDIHPGATVGRYFFIDHGTGVVIGETTTIGDNVKLYQQVTLGAKSFELNEDGSPVKGIKRHPDIGNNVVIYAGATILGGDTCIGDGCIIGGNVWLTHSVNAGETVINRPAEVITRQR